MVSIPWGPGRVDEWAYAVKTPRLTMEKVSHHMRLSDLAPEVSHTPHQEGAGPAHSLCKSRPLAAQNPAQRRSDEDIGDACGDGLQICRHLVRFRPAGTTLRCGWTDLHAHEGNRHVIVIGAKQKQ